MHSIHGELLKKYSYFMNVVVIKDLRDGICIFKIFFTSNSDSEIRGRSIFRVAAADLNEYYSQFDQSCKWKYFYG